MESFSEEGKEISSFAMKLPKILPAQRKIRCFRRSPSCFQGGCQMGSPAPEDLVQATEDIVLMKILAQLPDYQEKPFFGRRTAVLVSFIALFLLSLAFLK